VPASHMPAWRDTSRQAPLPSSKGRGNLSLVKRRPFRPLNQGMGCGAAGVDQDFAGSMAMPLSRHHLRS
jgi:hypothetical protein